MPGLSGQGPQRRDCGEQVAESGRAQGHDARAHRVGTGGARFHRDWVPQRTAPRGWARPDAPTPGGPGLGGSGGSGSGPTGCGVGGGPTGCGGSPGIGGSVGYGGSVGGTGIVAAGRGAILTLN